MRKLLKLLWVLSLVAAFFLLLLPYLSPRYSGLLDNMIHPFIPKMSDQFYAMSDLEKENAELRKKLAERESLEGYRNRLFEENQSLREIAKLPKRTDYEVILAQVSSRSPLTLKSRFVIDAGSEDGLVKGLPVMVEDSLYGRLVEVKKGHSIVRTIAEQDISVFCRIQATEIYGKLEGEVSGESSQVMLCKLTWLPRDVEINPGVLIETSGFSSEEVVTKVGAGLIPGGLKIGSVKSVSRNEKYQEAIIELSAKWHGFEYVSVLKKADE